MSIEKYEYKYYQNFIIQWQDFYDQSGYKLYSANIPAGYVPVNTYNGDFGLTPFENDPNTSPIVVNKTNNGFLNIFFDINLNPPNQNPKKITIKNINASLTYSQGYLFELSCQTLMKYPIQFLDSLSTFTIYEEYLQSNLGTSKATFNLKRLSGSNPLTTGANILQGQLPYLINPSLSFTLVFEYY